MTLSFGQLTFNILYLVPTLIVISHLGQRRMEARRVVAMRTPTDLPIVFFLLWTLLIVPFSLEPVSALRGFGWWLCNGFIVYYLVLNSRMVTDRRGTLIGVLVAGTVAIGLFELYSNTLRLDRHIAVQSRPRPNGEPSVHVCARRLGLTPRDGSRPILREPSRAPDAVDASIRSALCSWL